MDKLVKTLPWQLASELKIFYDKELKLEVTLAGWIDRDTYKQIDSLWTLEGQIVTQWQMLHCNSSENSRNTCSRNSTGLFSTLHVSIVYYWMWDFQQAECILTLHYQLHAQHECWKIRNNVKLAWTGKEQYGFLIMGCYWKLI
jgi:hypothetical protein